MQALRQMKQESSIRTPENPQMQKRHTKYRKNEYTIKWPATRPCLLCATLRLKYLSHSIYVVIPSVARSRAQEDPLGGCSVHLTIVFHIYPGAS